MMAEISAVKKMRISNTLQSLTLGTTAILSSVYRSIYGGQSGGTTIPCPTHFRPPGPDETKGRKKVLHELDDIGDPHYLQLNTHIYRHGRIDEHVIVARF